MEHETTIRGAGDLPGHLGNKQGFSQRPGTDTGRTPGAALPGSAWSPERLLGNGPVR